MTVTAVDLVDWGSVFNSQDCLRRRLKSDADSSINSIANRSGRCDDRHAGCLDGWMGPFGGPLGLYRFRLVGIVLGAPIRWLDVLCLDRRRRRDLPDAFD